MTNTFELKKGKLVFEEDKIVITDYAKYQKRYRLFTLTAGILLGITYLLKYIKTGDMFSLRFGFLMGIPPLLPFVLELLYSTKSEIPLVEVKSVKLGRIFFKDYLYIKLTNNRIRRVVDIYNAERLDKYIESISISK